MSARRQWLLAAGAVALGFPFGLLAQTAKMPRVGILSGRSREVAVESGVHGAFVDGMREFGYVDGNSIRYEWRYAAGDYAELRRMAEDLVRLKVDVILAEGTSAIGPAREATRTIPIVMSASADPVGAGFVASLARPGGNITGLTSTAVEATLKRLEILATTLPGLERVAVLANQNNPSGKAFIREVQSAARQFKLQAITVHAATPAEIQAAFDSLAQAKAGALIVPSDAFFNTQQRQIVELAAKARIPAMYPNREYFESGGLLVYGHHIADLYRRAAAYVDKILKGARPGELPVQQPDKFELLVNLKTAKALGIKIPQSLLMRADEVIH